MITLVHNTIVLVYVPGKQVDGGDKRDGATTQAATLAGGDTQKQVGEEREHDDVDETLLEE